ncbi:MAG: class I SAM-dependent methyltransferase, partial [bacterium]|nr:class I SAM-dependent methyltransferase [bacterium]
MNPGEQQTAKTLAGIKKDHLERYKLASGFIKPGDRVLDMASGTGYGSYLIAGKSNPKAITAVDRSHQAIEYGKKHYADRRIKFLAASLYEADRHFKPAAFDVICSVETLEHLEDAHGCLGILYRLLAPKGTLIISTPNQDVMPYRKKQFPFHTRHYTTAEI